MISTVTSQQEVWGLLLNLEWSITAFAIVVHLIVKFYLNFIRIVYFRLLQPQRTRARERKEKRKKESNDWEKVNSRGGREKKRITKKRPEHDLHESVTVL